MNDTINNYKEKLIELEFKKELLLKKIKNSYINNKVSKSGEAKNIYENDKREIDKLNSEFFILENELLNKLKTIKKEVNKNNNLVNVSKEELQKEQLEYLKEKSSKDASVPRYYELLEKL